MITEYFTAAEMLAKVMARSCNEPLLSDFKYLKSESAFRLKVKDGWYRLALVHSRIPSWWMKSRDDSEICADFLQIIPAASRRFDILWKWLEEYAADDEWKRKIRKLSDALINPKNFQLPEFFYFSLDGSNFEQEYHRLYMMIEILVEAIFHYPTIECFYNQEVKQYLKIPPHTMGFIGTFPYLLVSRIVDINNYSTLKSTMNQYYKKEKELDMFDYKTYEPKIPVMIERLEQLGDEIRAQRTPMPGIDHDPIWDKIRERIR